MSKLGYTFYTKDWGTSEKVFQLNLAERGLFRELIDLAFLNDNKTPVNKKVWIRKFNTTESELNAILDTLESLGLIELKETLFIPSCEPRLNLIRGGRKGGSKPKAKPTIKPTAKPTPKQNKIKEKESKYNAEDLAKYFKSKIEEHNLDSKKVFSQVKDAIEYYKDLNWKNSNGKEIINLKTTIWNNWIKKDLDTFKVTPQQKSYDW